MSKKLMQEGLRALTEQVRTNQGQYPGRGGGVGPPAKLEYPYENLPFTSKEAARLSRRDPIQKGLKTPAPSRKELDYFKKQMDAYYPGGYENAKSNLYKTQKTPEGQDNIRRQTGQAVKTAITQGPEYIPTEDQQYFYNQGRDQFFQYGLNIPRGAKTVDRTGVRGAPIFNKRIGAARRMLPKANNPGQLV